MPRPTGSPGFGRTAAGCEDVYGGKDCGGSVMALSGAMFSRLMWVQEFARARAAKPLVGCLPELLEVIKAYGGADARLASVVAPVFEAGDITLLIDHEDLTLAALGEQLAVYLPPATLAAMATSGSPRHARIAGEAIARGLERG